MLTFMFLSKTCSPVVTPDLLGLEMKASDVLLNVLLWSSNAFLSVARVALLMNLLWLTLCFMASVSLWFSNMFWVTDPIPRVFSRDVW